MSGSLDWATLSIDTLDPQKLEELGRVTRDGPLSEDDYLGVIDMLRERGIRLKINTVVTRTNCDEDLNRVHSQGTTGEVEAPAGPPRHRSE